MKKTRKLFCEISPLTYKISTAKCRAVYLLKSILRAEKISKSKNYTSLPILICSHSSLIRRRLGNVDLELQENKAVNLSLAAPKITNILIKPNETFSFWKLVGSCTAKKGYKDGLTISGQNLGKGIGGGMCQFTNLIHWMILHTPMEIVEYHHHDNVDLFPDMGRQIPFGLGTSIMYNYLDYRFKNKTDITFQLITYVSDEYLNGEIRADKALNVKYHIKCENEFFKKEADAIYRNNQIFREIIDKETGNRIARELIKQNHAKVLYDTSNVKVVE